MKKIISIFIICLCLCSCGINKHNPSQYSNRLNDEIDYYFKNELVEDVFSIDNLIKQDENIIKFTQTKRYVCAYLSNDIKDVLDSIIIEESNDLWIGIDDYLEKYEYAIENSLIDSDKSLLTWYDFNNEDDIVDEINGMFLVCIAKGFDISSNNVNETVYIDVNSIVYEEINDNEYLYLGDLMNNDFISLSSLMNNLYKFKNIDNEIYIKLDEEIKPCEYKVINEENYYKLNDIYEIKSREYKTIELSNKLIVELDEYLYSFQAGFALPPTSFEIKINTVKNGKDLMYVKYDNDNYYYACAYYNSSHGEAYSYCCWDEYIWVGYESEEDIQKYYRGNELVVSFQINKALYKVDLLTGKNIEFNVEHYYMYHPLFNEDNYSISSKIEFDDYFIMITDLSDEVYYSKDVFYHIIVNFDCVELDGKIYIMSYLGFKDGDGYSENLEYEFGEYYDVLMELMLDDIYSYTNKSGIVEYYGLFNIEDVVNLIKE